VALTELQKSEQQLDDDQKRILPKIQKLLALAAKNSNPEEAASAAARAQELLLAYNLSSDMLDEDMEGSARGEEQTKGGSRQYERDLWDWVAELNFCLHWVGQRRTKVSRRRIEKGDYYYGKPDDEIPEYRKWRTQLSWHHFLIGRKRNVAATIAMARYLQKRVDDLAVEFCHGDERMRYSQRAMSFREGAVSVIVHKLYERRQEQMAEERRREAEAMEAAARAGEAGASLETAVTIASLSQSERDENIDVMMGEPGYSARKRAERAAQAAAERAAEEEYTRWAAEHPEEAAAQEAERQKEAEKASKRRTRASRGSFTSGKEVDQQAYYAGRKAGQGIGIDPQAAQTKTAGLL